MSEKSFDELYRDILRQKIKLDEPLPPQYDPAHLDCLLHPENYAPVFYTESCSGCSEAYERACVNSCIFDAIEESEDGKLKINPEKCTGCTACIEACREDKLTIGRDVLPAMKAVRESEGPVYALVAPAFQGQFRESVTPGKLRSAFCALGFDGMIEVALFADILTMKEALEFERHVKQTGDFQLTSCCCPIWIAMVRKVYHELMPHMPGSVSPMIACGRVVKRLHPDAVTVFIGPCVAKKSEAREPDIAGVVDYVLTFQEVQDIFDAADIHPEHLPDRQKDHSSRAGRIYARTGGVSEAVMATVEQLWQKETSVRKKPYKHEKILQQEESLDQKTHISVRAEQADGVPACREMLARLQRKETTANFFEGMGCPGGCVGGPKAILEREAGKEHVDQYGDEAAYKTPLENPYVMKLMKRLGFETVEDLLNDGELFTRKF